MKIVFVTVIAVLAFPANLPSVEISGNDFSTRANALLQNYIKGVEETKKGRIPIGAKADCDIRKSELGIPFRMMRIDRKKLSSATVIDEALDDTGIVWFPVYACGTEWAQIEIVKKDGTWRMFRFGYGSGTPKRIMKTYEKVAIARKIHRGEFETTPALVVLPSERICLVYARGAAAIVSREYRVDDDNSSGVFDPGSIVEFLNRIISDR